MAQLTQQLVAQQAVTAGLQQQLQEALGRCADMALQLRTVKSKRSRSANAVMGSTADPAGSDASMSSHHEADAGAQHRGRAVPPPMSSEAVGGAGPVGRDPEEGAPVCVGTWNVSWWTGARLPPIASLGVQLLALQETKLSAFQLENARSSLKRAGYTLHHGRPVAVQRVGGHGDSCGVGVLAMPGVAVSPVLPVGAAWRRLHAMARVHAVLVPPRPGTRWCGAWRRGGLRHPWFGWRPLPASPRPADPFRSVSRLVGPPLSEAP